MATFDLNSAQAGSVRNAYKQYLGRDANDSEVSNWLSGTYGYGDASNLNPVLSAIQGSDEAKAYAAKNQPAPTVGQPGPGENTKQDQSTFTPVTNLPTQNNQSGNFWNFDNTAQQQIANWYQQYLGRLPGYADFVAHQQNPGGLPGIQQAIMNSAEAQAYANRPKPTTPPTTTPTTTGGTPPGGFQGYMTGLFGSHAPDPAYLESLAPQLAQYGIKLGQRNAAGIIDTIILPDGTVVDVIEGAYKGGGKRWQWLVNPSAGGNSGTGGQGLPGVQVPGQIYNDPSSHLLESLLGSRINQLLQPVNDPNRAQYNAALQGYGNALGQAEPALQKLLDFLNTRFTDLQGPGYTGAENEVLRTQALDPIERDRAAAKQRMMERLGAMGHTPESGVFQDAMRRVDAEYDAMRASSQGQLASNELARREDRAQRAQSIGAQLVDIPQQRARQRLDVFQALDLLSQTARNEDAARAREAITYGGSLYDMGNNAFQNALQAAGLGGNPSNLMGNLLGVAGLNQQSQLYNAQNNGSFWSGLGSILAYMGGGR